ncbi:restriction endonuclease subunit S, partial [Candidatus Bipolaricaulota bacterium]|nr:restriction endonuclease subunit S [Candidatus Bipolaricaulota bacterium]
ENYKVTELGPLPEEWQVVRLGDAIAEITTGDWGQSTEATGFVKCLVLRGTDFANAEQGEISAVPVRFIKASRLQKRRLAPGDLLVELSGGSKDQPTGRIMLITSDLLKSSGQPVVFTNFVKRLRLKNTIRSDYFRLYWEFIYRKGCTRIYEKRTTGIRNFKLKDFLKNEYIPLPPLPEQRAIARVLRTVQRAKEVTEGVIAALRELKKSLMHHLFTYGPVPLNRADQVPLKETEIGPVPEHWQVVRLGEVVQTTKQGDPRRTPETWFRYIDVSSVDRERLAIIEFKEYQGKDAPSRARKEVKAGDVIFATVRPYLKRIAIVSAEFDGQICSTAFCVLRPKGDVIQPEYLFFAVAHDRFVLSVSEHQRGSSYPAVTDNDVLREFIPLPPLEEQREIARILQTVDRRIEAEENRKEALEALFNTLLHHLMTAKIRVPRTMIREETGRG